MTSDSLGTYARGWPRDPSNLRRTGDSGPARQMGSHQLPRLPLGACYQTIYGQLSLHFVICAYVWANYIFIYEIYELICESVCATSMCVCVCLGVVVINCSTIICWHFMTRGRWAVSWNYPKDAFTINLQFNFYFSWPTWAKRGRQQGKGGSMDGHADSTGSPRWSWPLDLCLALTHASHTQLHSLQARG